MAPPRPPWRVDMRFTASRAQEGAEGIDLEDPAEIGRLDLIEASEPADDAGVVDQAVDPSEAAIDLAEGCEHVFFARDIALQAQGAAARAFDLAHHRLGRIRRLCVVHDHAPPRPRRAARDRRAGRRGWRR